MISSVLSNTCNPLYREGLEYKKEDKSERACHARETGRSASRSMLVTGMFNRVDVTPDDGIRGTLKREARRSSGDT